MSLNLHSFSSFQIFRKFSILVAFITTALMFPFLRFHWSKDQCSLSRDEDLQLAPESTANKVSHCVRRAGWEWLSDNNNSTNFWNSLYQSEKRKEKPRRRLQAETKRSSEKKKKKKRQRRMRWRSEAGGGQGKAKE